MPLGMIGLGRMGGNVSRRLIRAGHEIVAHGRNAAAVAALVGAFVPPRAAWLMLPATITGSVVRGHAAELAPRDIEVIDIGTSGGVWGLKRGDGLIIGATCLFGITRVVADRDQPVLTIPPATIPTSRSRPRGVSLAFMCTFIRSLRTELLLGNSNQLGLDRMDNLLKAHS